VEFENDQAPSDEDDDVDADCDESGLKADDGVKDEAQIVFESHTDSVYCVALSPDGTKVLSGGGDDVAYVWESSSGNVLSQLSGHTDSIVACAFNFDGSMCATGSYDTTVKIWDSKLLRTLEGPSTEIEWLQWHPKGNVLMAGSEDATIWVWDASNGNCLSVLAGHEGSVTCGQFTPNGKRILSGSLDGSVKIWDPKTSSCVHSFAGHDWHELGVVSLACHKEQPMIAAGGQDGTVRIARLESKKVVACFNHDSDKPKTHQQSLHDDNETVLNSVESVDFCQVNPWVASGGTEGGIKIWDLNSQSCRQVCNHDLAIVKVEFLPESPMIVSCSADGATRLWDTRSGDMVKLLTKHSDMTLDFDFNDQIVVSSSDDKTCRIISI